MISDSWPRRPNISRIYDDLLGGKDSYEEDRRFAGRLLAMVPDARVAARANKSFLARAVRFLVKEAGIRQVIFREADVEALLAAGAGLARCGGAGTPGVPVYERVFPGLPGQAREVRAALRVFLDGCPVAGDVIQLVSELAANAVLYSGSGQPGGQFTVRVRDCKGVHVYAEVQDQGSTWHADLARSTRPRHGLYLLREMSDACGTIRHPCARVVWFTIGYPRMPSPEHREPFPLREAAQ